MEPTPGNDQDKDQLPRHIKPRLSITQLEYMQDRVIYKMQLYDALADEQKWRYRTTSLISIILAPAVPVLINLGVDTIYPTILSLIVTIMVSVEKLFHFREHWRHYDEMAAFLRSEQLQFQTRAGEYAKRAAPQPAEAGPSEAEQKAQPDADGDAFQHFVTRIEQAISNERRETIEMRTTERSAA